MRRTLLLLASLVLGAGCDDFTGGALSEREVVVHFEPGTTDAVRQQVLDECGDLPNASPEPIPTASRDPATRHGNVRFRVDDADNRELNDLHQCLRRFPQVRGFNIPQEEL